MIAWALESLLASALLMLLVLALRVPVRRAFGPQLAYALWAIPVLRLVLPPLPDGWRGDMLPALPAAAEPITVYLADPVATLPVAAAPAATPWPAIVLAIWAAGAAAFLLWQVGLYARFRHRVMREASAVERMRSIAVVESAAATGPLAFGVLDRVVAFPPDFALRFDDAERELALAHELGHHARGDLLANWVALAVLALHWFNPVAWIAFRAFRADQEMANDAGVMAGRDAAARLIYGSAIVKAARGGAVSAACHLRTADELKGRLRMLGRKRVGRARAAAGTIVAGAVTLGAMGATASGTQAAERVRARVETATGVDVAALGAELSAVAQAPVAPATPGAGATPPAPPAPPAPAVPPAARKGAKSVTVVTQGKQRKVTVVADGRTTTYEGDAADAYVASHPVPRPPLPPTAPGASAVPAIPAAPAAPEPPHMVLVRPLVPMRPIPRVSVRPLTSTPTVRVEVRHCDSDAGGDQVRRTVRGKAGVTMVCADGVEGSARHTAEAKLADAERIRADALRDALAGLEQARARLADNKGLAVEHRARALAGIDRAIVQLRARSPRD